MPSGHRDHRFGHDMHELRVIGKAIDRKGPIPSPWNRISASDLEKYCYCPLSWSLSKRAEVTSSELDRGKVEHFEMAEDLGLIVGQREEGRFSRAGRPMVVRSGDPPGGGRSIHIIK